MRTDAGEQPAAAVVVAAGALAPRFQKALGCRVPVVPGKGYSLTLDLAAHGIPASAVPRTAVLLPEVRVAVTPHAGSRGEGDAGEGGQGPAVRLGSVMEFAGYDATVPRRRLGVLTRGAARFLNLPAEVPADDHPAGDARWAGWRPMTPDGLPLIGRAPAAANLYVAAGHNMLGLSMAPATGKLIAELIAGEPPHLDPAPYAPGRFTRGLR